VDLPDSQKSTIKVSKLFCVKNRDYFPKELSAREIDYILIVCQYNLKLRNGEPKKVQKKKTLKELKVLMLRYELKERAKTEDKLR